MNQTEFAISRFQNRNGITFWRLSGWLHGVRIRKNFKTREEAAAEKSTLEIKAEQIAAGLRSVLTTLAHEQVREAEAAFHRLESRTRSLTFYVDFALANYREPIRDISLAEAAREYRAVREQDLLHRESQSPAPSRNCVPDTHQTMSVLRQALDLHRAPESAGRYLCYSTKASVSSLVVVANNGTRWMLPWTHFVHGQHQIHDNLEQLVLTFVSHEVTMRGHNLGPLSEESAKLGIDRVCELPEEYRNAEVTEPYINKIVVRTCESD